MESSGSSSIELTSADVTPRSAQDRETTDTVKFGKISADQKVFLGSGFRILLQLHSTGTDTVTFGDLNARDSLIVLLARRDTDHAAEEDSDGAGSFLFLLLLKSIGVLSATVIRLPVRINKEIQFVLNIIDYVLPTVSNGHGLQPQLLEVQDQLVALRDLALLMLLILPRDTAHSELAHRKVEKQDA